jgi:hypothetical protein
MVYNGSAMTHEYSLAQVVTPEHGKQKRIVVQIMSTGEEVTFFRTGKSVIKKPDTISYYLWCHGW